MQAQDSPARHHLSAYWLVYAGFAYLASVIALLYAWFGITMSSQSDSSLAGWKAVLADVALVSLFGIQHSLMAREEIKSRMRRYIPEPLERSTYVLASALVLLLLGRYWQDTGGQIWLISNHWISNFITVLGWLGWALAATSTFLTSHSELTGLRQVWRAVQGKPPQVLPFREVLLYRFVRHPLYAGILTGCWSAADMDGNRFLLCLLMTAYVLLAIPLEERDLLRQFGETYEEYRKRVPALIPRWKGLKAERLKG